MPRGALAEKRYYPSEGEEERKKWLEERRLVLLKRAEEVREREERQKYFDKTLKGKRGLGISPARDLTYDIKKAERGGGYIPPEFRPVEEVEEEEEEKKPPITRGKRYLKIEEFPAPDSNPEALLMAKEEAGAELPEEEAGRLAEVELARESIEKERLQRSLAEEEASAARRGNVKNVKNVRIAEDVKTKRIGVGDEDIENKFDERDKRLIGQETSRIQKLGQAFKSHYKKRPGLTPKYKTQYSER